MATPITVVARAWTAAAPLTVYDLVADGATWPSWTPIGSFRLEREGDAGGQTTGAISRASVSWSTVTSETPWW